MGTAALDVSHPEAAVGPRGSVSSISQQPSGYHISFGESRRPRANDLHVLFVPNPPFLLWNLPEPPAKLVLLSVRPSRPLELVLVRHEQRALGATTSDWSGDVASALASARPRIGAIPIELHGPRIFLVLALPTITKVHSICSNKELVIDVIRECASICPIRCAPNR
jgi:hypothetical protein